MIIEMCRVKKEGQALAAENLTVEEAEVFTF